MNQMQDLVTLVQCHQVRTRKSWNAVSLNVMVVDDDHH